MNAKFQCEVCGKEYPTWSSWANRRENQHHYCSKICKAKGYSNLYKSELTRQEYDAKYRIEHKESLTKLAKTRYQKQKKHEYDLSRRIRNHEEVKEQEREYYQKTLKGTAKGMFFRARQRAKRQDIPFSITEDDIVIPEVCPVLGIRLISNSGSGRFQSDSPSLDKIIPAKGYVKGNVVVISNRANLIKGNATCEELERVAKWYRTILERGTNGSN